MAAHINVSVVMSTHNRAAVLPKALNALLAQTADVPYEIIAVDNQSTDSTAQIIRSKLSGSRHLRYVYEPQRGLPHGRNAGVRAARGSIIAFTDDDVEVPPDWVATIKRVFDAHPDVDVIGGPVRPIWPPALPAWLTRRQLGPFALGERGNAPMRIGADNAAPCLVGANFAFRREVFDRIGLFDPAYTKSQDRELQLRLWRAGGVGLYVPEMVISVEVPPERLTKKYFRYWYRTYGVYHSRMRLLDMIDRDGRLADGTGKRLLGVPGFLYRNLLASTRGWLTAAARFDGATAFYHENHSRYFFSYICERYREHVRHRSHTLGRP
jgi:glycosyltransferase involved in cell wall biosynthesis